MFDFDPAYDNNFLPYVRLTVTQAKFPTAAERKDARALLEDAACGMDVLMATALTDVNCTSKLCSFPEYVNFLSAHSEGKCHQVHPVLRLAAWVMYVQTVEGTPQTLIQAKLPLLAQLSVIDQVIIVH